jgi:hypothetical protein
MNVLFTSDFKNNLVTYGSNLRLSTYRLGKIVPGYTSLDELISKTILDDTYRTFESLWYEDNLSLNMTLDLSFVDENYTSLYLEENLVSSMGGYRTVIFVYYSDLNDNIVGLAFILCGEVETLVSGTKARSPLYLCREKGLNYITVRFPSTTVANIDRYLDNEDAAYIENKSNTDGVNTFLAVEGEFSNTDLLTRNSYCRYLRQRNSLKNSSPLYLDSNGEKVYSITTYKHYKKITIDSSNVIGNESPDYPGNYIYYVGNGNSANIEGTCVYDLYRVKNGNYTLIKSDCKEGLLNTALVQVSDMAGTISTTTTSNYSINQNSKIITFTSNSNKVERTNFIADLSFKSEIGDTKGKQVTIKSNVVQFVTYLKWSVEYSSNLGQLDESGNNHIVLLFDTEKGSKGWNPDGGDNKTGTIIIFSESKVAKENIKISSGDASSDTAFTNYFTTAISDGIFDSTNKRYKYTITITTSQSTEGSTKWFPLDSGGSSILILNTISIEGADKVDKEEAKFYCVQRIINPLTISTFIGNTWTRVRNLTFPGTLGVKELTNNYVTNYIENYNHWEATYNNGSDVILDNTNNNVIFTTTNPATSESFNVLTKVSCTNKVNTAFASITFKRRNADKSFDQNNWEDLIYCSPDNDCTLYFNMEKESDSGNYVTIESSTKYFYTDNSGNSYRLYLFDRLSAGSETQTFYVHTDELGYSGVYGSATVGLWGRLKMELEDSSINSYFSIESSGSYDDPTTKSSGTTYVKITSKTLGSEYPTTSWYPKSDTTGVYTPFSITITNQETNAVVEKFYCIIKPDLTDTIGFYNPETLEKVSSIKFLNSEIQKDNDNKRQKRLYIASTVGSIDGLNYWEVFKKDLEVTVSTDRDNYGYGNLLITGTDSSKWGPDGSIVTYLGTTTIPQDSQDYSMDSLYIRRIATKYESKVAMFSDWKNQLSDGSTAELPIQMEGKEPTTTLQVYVLGSDGLLSEIQDETPLELDHIGLYKIYVKSTDNYRVLLEDTNTLDHFYFYDTELNVPKPTILSVDEGSFNTITGREVCFSFYGNERDTFNVVEQTLRTYIKVINLGDNTSIYIPLHRKYYLKKSDSGNSFESPVIDTNISMLSSDISGGAADDIFLPSSGALSSHTIYYKSYLETITKFIPLASGISDSSIIIDGDNVTLDYDTYSSTGKVVRSRITSTVAIRGYISHYSKITFNNPSSPDKSYPISDLGMIRITNPQMFNGEKIAYNLYKLLPPPALTVTKYSILLSYLSGKSTTVGVSIEAGGFYNIIYTDSTGTVTITTDGTIIQSPNKNVLIQVTDLKKDSTTGLTTITIKVTDSSNTTLAGDANVTLGTFTFSSYVDCNNFIKDSTGNLVVGPTYTQDVVNNLVPPNVKKVDLVRLSQKNSADSITGDTSVIKRQGETRTFTLNRINDGDAVDTSTALNEIPYLSAMNFSQTGELAVTFKDKLTRHNYSPISISIDYDYSTANYKYYLDKSFVTDLISKYVFDQNSLEKTNFYVYVKDNGTATNKVEMTDIVQENWVQGIRLRGQGYSSSILYLGENNTFTEDLSYDAGSYTMYVASVMLPTTDDSTVTETEDVHYNFLLLDTKKNLNIASTSLEYNLDTSNPVSKENNHSYSSTYGCPLTFSIPTNDSDNTKTYNVTLSDTYGNEVAITFNIKPNSQFDIRAFSGISCTGVNENDGEYYVDSFNELSTDELAFSASGALRYPDNYIYIATNAPVDKCIFGMSTNDDGNLTMADSSVNMVIDGLSVRATITSKIKSQTRINGVGSNVVDDFTVDYVDYTTGVSTGVKHPGYRLFKVEPWSKVSTINYQTWGSGAVIPNDKYMAHKPYLATNRFYIDVSGFEYNYTDVKRSRYGAGSLQLYTPNPTYLNCRKWSAVADTSGSYTYESPNVVSHDVDFGKFETSENSKYTAGSSYFLSNNKVTAVYNGSELNLDNTLYVTYKENSNGGKKYGELLPDGSLAFKTYGYYCAFMLVPIRYEWICTVDTNRKKTWSILNYTKFIFTSNDSTTSPGLNLVDNTDRTKSITVYHDEMITQASDRVGDYAPTTISGIPKYYSSNTTYSPNTDVSSGGDTVKTVLTASDFEKNSYIPAVLLELGPSNFSTKGNNVYTLNNASKRKVVVSCSAEGVPTAVAADDLVFNIDISLIL